MWQALGLEPSAQPPDSPPPRRPCVPGDEERAEHPALRRREVVGGDRAHRLILHQQLACVSQQNDLHALPCEQPCQCHDERRHPDEDRHRALDQADDGAGHQGGEDRGHARPAVVGQQHAEDAGRHAGNRAEREVDLAEQEDDHDADGQRADDTDLQDEIREVARRQEAVVLALKEQPDQAQANEHRPGS